MSNRNSKRIADLVKVPGNDVCGDCGLKNPEWASYNIGVFLCTTCATSHRKIGSHISKVKSLKLDKWDDQQVEEMEQLGNIAVEQKHLVCFPSCYRIPRPGDPQVLFEQWIRAKYERQEFLHVDKQVYQRGIFEGTLMKKAKDENKYYPRKFYLSELENSLKYYTKENSKEPKTTIALSELNACLAPSKMHQENGLQLSYITEGSTRHMYLSHESGEVIVQWYMAIRSAKLNWLKVAYPSASDEELLPFLSRDFAAEGWLSKTGPGEHDAYRKRWFILDDRKLMYHTGQLDAFPRGEIFLGHKDDGFSVVPGVPPNCKTQDFPFSLHTPDRVFVMSVPSSDEREHWINAINTVLLRSLRPQDNLLAVNLVRKRAGKFSLDIFSLG